MFGDPNLDIRINEVERKADRAGREIDRTEGDVNELRKKVGELSVVCRALMELLQEHTPCTAEQIQICLLYASPSPRVRTRSRMPSSA